MYSNIGRKIKVLSQVVGLLSMIAGIIVWIHFITNSYTVYDRYSDYTKYLTADDWIGWLSLVAGFFSIIASWPLYGFGELIELADEIAINTGRKVTQLPPVPNIFKKIKAKDSIERTKLCPYCGEVVESGKCEMCGKDIS